MSMTPEGRVKKDVKGILKDHGAFYFMPVSNGMGVMGISDFICVVPPRGRILVIEVKADASKKPTALQEIFMTCVVKCGGLAIVVHNTNLHELTAVLKREKERDK
jgi:hypothetical protein